MEQQAQPLLKLVNIQKRFGPVEALRRVDLEIGTNEVVGLLGDNGAGKSTLIKIITGVHAPDQGEIRWRGSPLRNYSVAHARSMGICTVFQDRALCEQHPIWRNIFMGREIVGHFGFVNVKREKEETGRLMRQMMGFTSSAITPDAIVGTLNCPVANTVAPTPSRFCTRHSYVFPPCSP
jgi:simple sugar transport system ATP-binding protein